MAIRTRVDPIDRDVMLSLTQDLTPAGRSQAFAAVAKDMITEADEANRSVLGRIPPRKTYVDGIQGAALESVKPSGVIVAEWELVADVLVWIAKDLVDHSPVGRSGAGDKHPGLYKRSHTLFADGVEVDVGGQIPIANEYVFLNPLPYTRKLEGGSSRQFAHIYEGSAKRAAARFGNIAKISLGYRAAAEGKFVQISRIGPLQVKRNSKGQFVKGSHVRAGNAQERSQRVPAVIVRIG